MKRFEFRLKRVLELRQQQAEVEAARLETLRSTLERLDQYEIASAQRVEEARAFVKHGETAMAEDLVALSSFEAHMQRVMDNASQQREQLTKQIAEQRTRVVEVERKVRLLMNLEKKQLSSWTVLRDKEIEEMASDSYLSRLVAQRRRRPETAAGVNEDGGGPA